MKIIEKILLDQLTTIDYESGAFTFLEKAHENLVEELLMKVRMVFQKVSK